MQIVKVEGLLQVLLVVAIKNKITKKVEKNIGFNQLQKISNIWNWQNKYMYHDVWVDYWIAGRYKSGDV